MINSAPPDHQSPLSAGWHVRGTTKGSGHSQGLLPLDLNRIACRQTVAAATIKRKVVDGMRCLEGVVGMQSKRRDVRR
jgi:hypothetical protein